jgi:hypothetical protein
MRLDSTRTGWAAVAALLASTALASAQSLGELAAKEKERRDKERQKRGGASKVLTENDLRGAGRGTFSNAGATNTTPAPEASPAPGAATDAKAAAAPAKEKSADEIRAEQENDWRQRIQQARDEETRLAAELDRLQQSLNDLSGPVYGSGRTALLNQFETTKTSLAAARQKVLDLEEEGRRNSYR